MAQKDKLFHCIKNNNLRQAKLLLDAGCDVNVRDALGRTPLLTSCLYTHQADTRRRLVQLLLQAGSDVNAIDKQRKSALTYACTLNQLEVVDCLLQQPELDPNTKDKDGATALMHAAALSHLHVIQTMMEYHRSGSVAIDIDAQDDNGHTAADHAKTNNSKVQQQATSGNNEKIINLLDICDRGTGAIESSPKKVITPNVGIELVDMSHRNKGKKKKAGVLSDHSKTQRKMEKQNIDAEAESMVDCSYNIREWASGVKQQHDESGKMSSLLSSSSGNTSRPASKLGTFKGSSALDRATPSRLTTPLGKTSSDKCQHLSVEQSSSGDEDGDISLQSLSELVGTVRQYAQEIREIYAPIQKEEEERTRRRNEKNERKKQKSINKQSSIKSDTLSTGSFQHEVVVEIHKIENNSKKSERQKPHGPSHSRSCEPSGGPPLASLHVENEQLSSTWPRGRQRPRSRDRFRHDMHIHAKDADDSRNQNIHGSTSSIASAPNPGNFSRPRIPSDWNEDNSLQQERNILNKAFQKCVKSNDDPLLTTLNKNKKNFKLQDQVASSRQSVIQLGKSHQLTKKAEVPSISVIPPPEGEFGHRAFQSKGHGEPIHEDSVQPSGPLVSDQAPTHTAHRRFGREPKTSANKGGLRRRKSVDQGLGQQVFLQKY